MAGLGPFGLGNRVAVAVSGGADSMALALLLAGWGQPTALIVDHGLRPASAFEAALAAARLTSLGIAARVLPCLDLTPGPAAAERARDARYAALAGACRASGHPDLLVAHHARDQAETVLLRRRAGSGPAGLAGMSVITHGENVRVLRPLLAMEPARLRATLRAAGVPWIEDPSNTDPATPRARIRIGFDGGAPPTVPDLCRDARCHGTARQAAEAAVANELAQHTTLLPNGVAVVTTPTLSPAALSTLIWMLSGKRHPPARTSVARLAGQLRPATLHGAIVTPSGLGWLIGREAAAMAPPVAARAGVRWDDRFQVQDTPPKECTIGPVGDDAGRLRRWSSLPAALLRTLPAIRCNHTLFAVPHLAYPNPETCAAVSIAFCPSRPAGVAPFLVA